jgi:hypothetical protein
MCIKFTGETTNRNTEQFTWCGSVFHHWSPCWYFRIINLRLSGLDFSLQSDYIFFWFFTHSTSLLMLSATQNPSIHPNNQQTPTRNKNYHAYCSEHKSHQHCKKHNHILPHLNWFVDLMWLCESTVVGGFLDCHIESESGPLLACEKSPFDLYSPANLVYLIFMHV